MRPLLILLACLAAHSLLALNADIRCGKIVDFKKVDAGVVWEWKEELGYGPEPVADGDTFAIVTVKLKAKRSIGKYDYTLNGAKCLAMAKNNDPFTPDYWEQVYEADHDQINLIFRVPDQERYVFNYELTAREPKIFLPEGTSDAVPAAAPPAAAGGDGAAVGDGDVKDIVGEWEITAVDPSAQELAEAAVKAMSEIMGEEVTQDGNVEAGNDIVGKKWSFTETAMNMDGMEIEFKAEGNKLSIAKPTEAEIAEAGPMAALVQLTAKSLPDAFTFSLEDDVLTIVSGAIEIFGGKTVTYTLKRAVN